MKDQPHFERLNIYSSLYYICHSQTNLGLVSALAVYIAQSVQVQNPISDYTSAEMLRSSKWNRSNEANSILDNKNIGRSRICLIQLQGHLFFGNVAKLNESLHNVIEEHQSKHGKVWIVIIDFSLVLGIDASAAMSFAKIKDRLHDDYDITWCIYVTGEERDNSFPCEYKLEEDLIGEDASQASQNALNESSHSQKAELHTLEASIGKLLLHEKKEIAADHICQNLDEALSFAEDALIARVDASLCDDLFNHVQFPIEHINNERIVKKELLFLQIMLKKLLPTGFNNCHAQLIDNLDREVYYENDIVWEKHSPGSSCKFVVRGLLIGVQDEDRNVVERIDTGQVVGEASLVINSPRTSTVRVKSQAAVLYSMNIESYNRLLEESPNILFCELLTRRVRYAKLCTVIN